MMRVAFRADGDALIGTGHVMRCLTLANALADEGVDCTFISRHLSPGLVALLQEHQHAAVHLRGGPPGSGGYAEWLGTTEIHDAVSTGDVLPVGTDVSVVDHYALNLQWEAYVRQRSRRLVAIDDLRRAHAVDLVVDPTLGTRTADYAVQAPGVPIRAGVDYAMLRPGFARARASSLRARDTRHGVRNVLVAMGGGDPQDWSARLCEALHPVVAALGARLHVVTGTAYPHRQTLSKRATGRFEVHHALSDMTSLYASMDLCVGAAGSSSWERCCLGLPTVNVVMADNQRTVHANLVAAGAVVDGGRLDQIGVARATRELQQLLVDDAARRRLSLAARTVVDGFGTWRVKGALLGPLLGEGEVRLRDVRLEDSERLHDWQCFPGTRRFAVDPSIPSRQAHDRWMGRRVVQPGFHIAEICGVAVGMLRLDPSVHEPVPPVQGGSVAATVSIVIAPGLHGIGIGRRVLEALQFHYRERIILARVLSGNIASRRLFERSGFLPYAPEHLYWHA